MKNRLPIVFFCLFFISACGPSLEDAQKLGFRDLEEMTFATEAGINNAEELAKSKEFKDVTEMRTAEANGFNTALEYAKSQKFLSVKEMRDLEARRVADPYFDFPKDQRSFIQIILVAQRNQAAAENDMQRGGVKYKRDSEICDSVGRFVKGWFGTVDKVDSNSDGLGTLSIYIAPDIRVKTWSNAFSDRSDSTLIQPSSELFMKASSLKVGDKVVFSGNFFTGNDGDCFKESSLTLQGKLADPEFIFRFRSVEQRS